MPKPSSISINPFREFFHKEDIDFHNLDEHTLVVFDTNTLLNIYRYSNDTRDQLIKAIEKIKSNIWMPYQVGLEFNLQRRQVWMDLKSAQQGRPESAKKAISEAKNKLKAAVSSVAIKSIDAADKKREIENFINERLDQLQSDFISKFNELDAMIDLNDDLAAKIATLFSDKIGECYTQEDLDAKLNDAEVRYIHEIPPGYKDGTKDSITYYNGLKFNKKYGDLIVWHQIIDKAQEENINKVIFVTDDNKEDWWYIYKGKTIGPRAELKNELLRKSKADFYMFNTNSFLSQFSEGKNLIEPTLEQITFPLTAGELDINNVLKADTEEDLEMIFRIYDLEKTLDLIVIERSKYLSQIDNAFTELEMLNTAQSSPDFTKNTKIDIDNYKNTRNKKIENLQLKIKSLEKRYNQIEDELVELKYTP